MKEREMILFLRFILQCRFFARLNDTVEHRTLHLHFSKPKAMNGRIEILDHPAPLPLTVNKQMPGVVEVVAGLDAVQTDAFSMDVPWLPPQYDLRPSMAVNVYTCRLIRRT